LFVIKRPSFKCPVHIVRIGCQRSTYRQNSSFPSFVYCSPADLDASHSPLLIYDPR
jgi:hypothetical protein